MPASFQVEVITPERELYNGPAQVLSVPGVMGSLGILANHAPLLTELKLGEATLTEPGGQRRHFYIGGGFLEVNKNHVTILAEDAALAEEITAAEAERLQREARATLDASPEGSPEATTARQEYDRATARLDVARKNQ